MQSFAPQSDAGSDENMLQVGDLLRAWRRQNGSHSPRRFTGHSTVCILCHPEYENGLPVQAGNSNRRS